MPTPKETSSYARSNNLECNETIMTMSHVAAWLPSRLIRNTKHEAIALIIALVAGVASPVGGVLATLPAGTGSCLICGLLHCHRGCAPFEVNPLPLGGGLLL